MRIPAAKRTAVLSTAAVLALLSLAVSAHADMSAIRINEIGWATRAGDANTQFVELVATAPGQTRDAELHLEVTTGLGATSDLLVSFGATEGAAWPQDGKWLLGGSAFTTKTGLVRDGAMSRIDAAAGTLTLYTFDNDGNRVDLDSYSWGRAAGQPRAPYNGQSLQRVASGFTRQSHPTPTNSAGASSIDISYGYEPQTNWVIDEAMLACANGAKGMRFVTARSGAAQYYDPNLTLRATNAFGNVIIQTRLLAGATNQPVAAGTRWLAASAAFSAGVGPAADLTLAGLPDSLGGNIELVLPNSGGDTLEVIDHLAYGSAGGAPLPDPGKSLQRQSDGSFAAARPTPSNRAGQGPTNTACFDLASAALPVWRIDEFGVACKSDAPGFWFLELRAMAPQRRDSRVGVRMRDAAGTVVSDQPDIFGGSITNVPANAPTLLASPGFQSVTGLSPDLLVPLPPSLSAGRIEVYVTLGSADSVVSELTYGPTPGQIPPPPAGGSIQYSPSGYATKSQADPQRSDGTLATGECFSGVAQDGMRLDEIGLQCDLGSPAQFIELQCVKPNYTFDGRTGLRLFNHTGALLSDLSVGSSLKGQTIVQGTRLLLATAQFNAFGVSGDILLPSPPDLAGGRVVLYRTALDGGEQILSDVRYGAPAVTIPPGASLQRVSDSEYQLSAVPSPTNLSGRVGGANCFVADTTSISFQSFGTRCRDDVASSFIELGFDLAQVLNTRVGLRVMDRNGLLLADFAGIFTGRRGTAVSRSQRFLLGSAAFAATSASPPDTTLSTELDVQGGSLELYLQDPFDPLVHRALDTLHYGPGSIPAPGDGESQERQPNGTFVLKSPPTPTDLLGRIAFSRCWFPPDTSTRIDEVAFGCYTGVADTRFIELGTLDPNSRIDGGLRIRIRDGQGTVLEDRPAVPAGLIGRSWGSGGILLALNDFTNGTGVAPDVVLSNAPPADSGSIQLYLRDSATSPEAILHTCRYGFHDAIAAPPRGAALVRSSNVSFSQIDQQTALRHDGTLPTSTCFQYLPPSYFVVTRLGLECSDGSSSASFVELGCLHAGSLDPSVGIEIRDSSGNVIANLPHLFASRAWDPIASTGHFLLAPASAQGAFGVTPDATLPAPLDTAGGRITVYFEIAPGVRIATNQVAYSRSSTESMPVPGFVYRYDYDATGNARSKGPVAVPNVHRYPNITVATAPCYRDDAPRVQLSEVSPGCGFEPMDETGAFLELRNDGPARSLPDGVSLRQVTLTPSETPLFTGHIGENWPAGANWLIADRDFAALNGIIPDQVLTSAGVTNLELRWQPAPGVSSIVLDRLQVQASIGNTGPGIVNFGQSIEKLPNDSLVTRTLPNPRNSHGDVLTAASSCFGAGAPASPTSVLGFAPRDANGDPATGFVQLGYASPGSTPSLRMRIQDHTGAIVVDQGDLFGPAGGAGPPGPIDQWTFWLIGAPGFTGAALLPADAELPLPIDPAGGVITLYQAHPSAPETIHSRYRFGAIAKGWGFGADPYSEFGRPSYPYLARRNSLPIPANNKRTSYSSRYGALDATQVFIDGAGIKCDDGDSRYVRLTTPTVGSCYERFCSSYTSWPLAGRLRTLDAHGAVLDSVELRDPDGLGAGGSIHGLFYPVLATGPVATAQGFLPPNRAPRMDPAGGTIQFVTLDPLGAAAATVRSVDYGTVAGQPAPTNAYIGGWPAAFPRDDQGRTSGLAVCPGCDQHNVVLNGYFGTYPPPVSNAAQFDSSMTIAGTLGPVHRQFRVDGIAGQSELRSDGRADASMGAMTSTGFTLAGVSGSSPVTIRVRLALSGSLKQEKRYGFESASLGFAIEGMVDAMGGRFLTRGWPLPGTSADTTLSVRDTLGCTITVIPGLNFHLTTAYVDRGNTLLGALDLTAQWLFDGLPAGAHITSCAGFGGGPVPTGLALASADAYLDHVDLAWVGGDVSTRFTVERSDADGVESWLPLATVLADGSGRIAYRDGSVAAGAAYRYRLRGSNGSTAPEADVHVPSSVRLTLAISGAQPVHGALQFAVTRPGSAAARLELFDVAGRLVESHVFAAGGAPSEQVALDPAQGRAGIFMARLTCGRESRTVRVVRVP